MCSLVGVFVNEFVGVVWIRGCGSRLDGCGCAGSVWMVYRFGPLEL